MFFTIELLYFVLMIGVFVALLLWLKLPSGICLMISAVVGAIAAAIFGGLFPSLEEGTILRYLVEGTFGYFDTILTITTAMIFMGAMQVSGALEYISALIVKVFRKSPTILLIAFMIIIMFPAMVTGSSLASAISAGALVAPIMIKWGIPKKKVGAIVAMGSILGMIAPPVDVPAMVICDVVDIPYTDFELPLLTLAIPLAIVSVIILGRKHVAPISDEQLPEVINVEIFKELNWTVTIPLLVLIALIACETIWKTVFGALAMPAMFTISTIVCFFVGRKLPFYKKPEQQAEETGEITDKQTKKEPNCVVEVISQGVEKSFSAMGLLMGVGMFMEILTYNGARGYFVTLAVSLPDVFKYIAMAVTLPLFGGISAFGSASILGGPFVMALNGISDNIYATCGLAMLAAIGEFLPPTAMSATFATEIVGEKKWLDISKSAWLPLVITLVYSVIYILLFGTLVQKSTSKDAVKWILLAVVTVLSVAFAFVYDRVVSNKKTKVEA